MAHQRVDPTYWEYIRLDRLLRLQGGVELEGEVESTDELHFIVIHQAIELLFKLVLRELRETRAALGRPHLEERAIPDVCLHLSRVNEALGVTAAHFSFMETLGTQGFLSFRDKLGTSSGAQSFQMRELEDLLGLPRSERERVLRRLRAELAPSIVDSSRPLLRDLIFQTTGDGRQGFEDGSDRFTLAYVEAAQSDIESQGTLRSALAGWLFRTPICGSSPDHGEAEDQAAVRAFVADYIQRGRASGWTSAQSEDVAAFMGGADLTWTSERVRAALLFIETYSDLPLLAWPRLVLDRLVELEARLVAFRNGHARMVERVIGDRPGTGGSAGIKYLDLTRDARVFPELVQVRGLLFSRGARWAFPGIEQYNFATG